MSGCICHTLNIWFVEALISKLCHRESLTITFHLKQRIFMALKLCCLFTAPNKCKSDSFWMLKTAAGAFAASLHFQEVRKVQWRESKLVDCVIAFIKERREFFWYCFFLWGWWIWWRSDEWGGGFRRGTTTWAEVNLDQILSCEKVKVFSLSPIFPLTF